MSSKIKRDNTKNRCFFLDKEGEPGRYVCASTKKDAMLCAGYTGRVRVTEVKQIGVGYLWYDEYLQIPLIQQEKKED